MTTGRRIITWFMTAHWGGAALFVIIHSVRIEGKKIYEDERKNI